jgi:hypothetical protein
MYIERDVSEVPVEELSNGEIQNAFLDSRELENARLALHRALGMPEPELYPDEPSEEDRGPDLEEKLNLVIELQERMERGMTLIRESQKKLDYFSNGHHVEREVWMSWVNRRSRLWKHWYSLKNQCASIIGEDTVVWFLYFKLKEEDLSDITIDTEASDNLESLFLSQNETIEEVLINEIREGREE